MSKVIISKIIISKVFISIALVSWALRPIRLFRPMIERRLRVAAPKNHSFKGATTFSITTLSMMTFGIIINNATRIAF
jgi:hypothetical protein